MLARVSTRRASRPTRSSARSRLHATRVFSSSRYDLVFDSFMGCLDTRISDPTKQSCPGLGGVIRFRRRASRRVTNAAAPRREDQKVNRILTDSKGVTK